MKSLNSQPTLESLASRISQLEVEQDLGRNDASTEEANLDDAEVVNRIFERVEQQESQTDLVKPVINPENVDLAESEQEEENVNLIGANIRGANSSKANFSQANLSEADLSSAILAYFVFPLFFLCVLCASVRFVFL